MSVPADSPFSLILVVKMPYTKAEFDAGKQDAFKEAMASAAGISPLNIDILSITEGRRRSGSVAVETKLRVMDSASLQTLASTLGTGDAMLANINAELAKRGLPASTGVAVVANSNAQNGLSGGSIAGIVVGVSFAAVIFLGVPVVYMKNLQNAGSDKISQAGKTVRGGVDQLKTIAEESNATNGTAEGAAEARAAAAATKAAETKAKADAAAAVATELAKKAAEAQLVWAAEAAKKAAEAPQVYAASHQLVYAARSY